MIVLKSFNIKGSDDLELDIKRDSSLTYHIAYNESKEPDGMIFSIPVHFIKAPALSPRIVITFPWRRMTPVEGWYIPAINLSKDDLPAPLWPFMCKQSPSDNSKLTSERALTINWSRLLEVDLLLKAPPITDLKISCLKDESTYLFKG